MAKLPDIAGEGRFVTPQPTLGVADVQAPNWRQANMQGQGIASAGRDLEEAAGIVAATNERQDGVVAQAAATQLAQARLAQEFDPKTGFRNAKQGQAVGQQFLDAYTEQWKQAVESTRSALHNDNQRRLFDQHAAVQSLQFKSALLQHQAVETEKFNDLTDDATLKTTLQEMATRPGNELAFQTGLTQIGGVIDNMAKRKGLGPEQVAALKTTYTDAAYGTRINAVLNGIPGVIDANPYVAEAMFRQVQDKLGPVTQAHLAGEITKGVRQVQQRDLAQAIINGGPVLDARTMQRVTDGTAPLTAVVQSLESGGRRYGADGALLTSPAGAQGEMQVMPGTARNPGFGIAPAKNDSPDEIARVGREYVGAMTARYQDPALVLAAYNAGPGQVDKWISQYGDPRSGQISTADWVAKIPFGETRNYVTAGLSKMGGGPAAAVTKNELKTELPEMARRAQDLWQRMYPNDPAGADAVAARVMSYGNQILAGVQAQQQAAVDGVMRLLVAGAKTVDDVIATPEGKQAWSNLTPEAQYTLTQRLKKEDNKLTETSFRAYYALLGQATNDPEAFSKVDLGTYFGQIPDHLLLQLSNTQKAVGSKELAQQQKDLAWGRSKSAVTDMLKASGIDPNAKANTEGAKTLEQFYGRYQEALQTYHDQSQKWPSAMEARKIASGLLAQGAQRGGWLWDSKTLFFQSPDASQFYVPLPAPKTPEYAALAQSFQKVMGRAPQGSELEAFYTKYKLAGGR